MMSQPNELGFFKSLFDFKITSYISMRVIRVIYAIMVVLTIIAGVLLFIQGVFFDGFGYGSTYKIIAAIGVPIATLLYLIILRLWFEFTANFYRIGENTAKLVAAQEK